MVAQYVRVEEPESSRCAQFHEVLRVGLHLDRTGPHDSLPQRATKCSFFLKKSDRNIYRREKYLEQKL
jgi:hypothetical protein